MVSVADLTKTQKKILELLSDGDRHHKNDMIRDLGKQDSEDPGKLLRVHITNLRKILNPIGQDIVCQRYNRSLYYRWVRLIGSNSNS